MRRKINEKKAEDKLRNRCEELQNDILNLVEKYQDLQPSHVCVAFVMYGSSIANNCAPCRDDALAIVHESVRQGFNL